MSLRKMFDGTLWWEKLKSSKKSQIWENLSWQRGHLYKKIVSLSKQHFDKGGGAFYIWRFKFVTPAKIFKPGAQMMKNTILHATFKLYF